MPSATSFYLSWRQRVPPPFRLNLLTLNNLMKKIPHKYTSWRFKTCSIPHGHLKPWFPSCQCCLRRLWKLRDRMLSWRGGSLGAEFEGYNCCYFWSSSLCFLVSHWDSISCLMLLSPQTKPLPLQCLPAEKPWPKRTSHPVSCFCVFYHSDD